MASPTLQSLQADIQNLQRQVAGLSTTAKNATAPLNPSARDKTNQFNLTSDQIIDIVWGKYFYWMTLFESTSGYNITTASSGTVSITGNYLKLAADSGSTGSKAVAQKQPTEQVVLRWDKQSRMHVGMSMSASTNQTIYLTVGDFLDVASVTIYSHYGFYISGATLYGTASATNTRQTVALTTLSASTHYDLEARFIPNKRVDFYVNKQLLGSLTDVSKLPSADTPTNLETVFNSYLINTASEGKIVDISIFEYIQER